MCTMLRAFASARRSKHVVFTRTADRSDSDGGRVAYDQTKHVVFTIVLPVFGLPSLRIGNRNYNFNFVFWPVSGRTWPRDPFNRVGLEK